MGWSNLVQQSWCRQYNMGQRAQTAAPRGWKFDTANRSSWWCASETWGGVSILGGGGWGSDRVNGHHNLMLGTALCEQAGLQMHHQCHRPWEGTSMGQDVPVTSALQTGKWPGQFCNSQLHSIWWNAAKIWLTECMFVCLVGWFLISYSFFLYYSRKTRQDIRILKDGECQDAWAFW